MDADYSTCRTYLTVGPSQGRCRAGTGCCSCCRRQDCSAVGRCSTAAEEADPHTGYFVVALPTDNSVGGRSSLVAAWEAPHSPDSGADRCRTAPEADRSRPRAEVRCRRGCCRMEVVLRTAESRSNSAVLAAGARLVGAGPNVLGSSMTQGWQPLRERHRRVELQLRKGSYHRDQKPRTSARAQYGVSVVMLATSGHLLGRL